MNFDLDQEHELVRSTVRDFAEQRVAPVAEELDREGRFPYDLVGELAELGLMGMTIPQEYGGSGADTVSYALAIEELTRIDSSFADLKNSSDLRQGSPVLAAEFLREFSGEGPWAHIDMAGPGFLERSRGDYLTQRGGTGYGVRLIVELAQRLASEPLG